MLIMHGLRDNRVASSQSRVWVQTLQKYGVPVEWIKYPEEDHYLTRSKSTLADRLKQMADFFQLYLGPLR